MDIDAKSTAQETDSNPAASTATVAPAPIVTAVPSNHQNQTATLPQFHLQQNMPSGGGSKYNQLLALIEELGKDIRPTYTGNRNCTERLKRAIGHARALTRECINDVEKNARQSQ